MTVKQFGYSARPGPGRGTGNVARIDGMPEYLPEQTYLIFLGPRSSLGFSAPVGLYQGAFLINDAKQAVNALGNRNLTFDGSGGATVSSASAGDSDLVRGPVSYPRLKALIQQLVLGEEISLSSMASQLKGVDRWRPRSFLGNRLCGSSLQSLFWQGAYRQGASASPLSRPPLPVDGRSSHSCHPS